MNRIARKSCSPLTMPTTVFILLIAVLLTGCDGGLFGTGDGSDIIEFTASAPDSEDVDTESPPETTQGESPNAGGNAEASGSATTTFSNTDIGSDISDPALVLLNLSSFELNINSDTTEQALFDIPIAPNTLSETVSLSIGENSLEVIDQQTDVAIFSFNPLNAGTSSVTMLMARYLNESIFDVVALSTFTISDTPSVAQVRVVQANQLGDTDPSATIKLIPDGLMPGSSNVDFLNVSAASASEAQYQAVGAGSYLLSDTLNRFEPIELSVSAGEIYTLVIDNTVEPGLRIQIDTQLLD